MTGPRRSHLFLLWPRQPRAAVVWCGWCSATSGTRHSSAGWALVNMKPLWTHLLEEFDESESAAPLCAVVSVDGDTLDHTEFCEIGG